MIPREIAYFVVISSAGIFAMDLFELPMNLAGFMSIERASDACEDRINEAVELTLGDANIKCEEAIRQNLENIERSDEDVFLRVMEATRKQEELRCVNIVEGSLAEAAAAHEKECQEQITIEKKVGLTLFCVKSHRSF